MLIPFVSSLRPVAKSQWQLPEAILSGFTLVRPAGARKSPAVSSRP
jgi:hypothetical protein